MAHLDPDRLILLALDEQDPTAAETAHLDLCLDCRDELGSTRSVASVARDGADLRDLPEPSPTTWDRIAAEAFGSPAAVPQSRRPGPSRRAVLALTAAACLALGAVGATGVQALLRGEDDGTVLALADLTPVAGAPAGAHGTARVIDTGHGRQVEISIDGVPPVPGYYTVWIYDGRDVMIPLGSPGTEPLNLPAAATDLAVFHIVDVSVQDLGQQEHGRSVLQGTLHG